MRGLEQPEGRAVPAGRPTSDPASSWRAHWCSRRRWSSAAACSRSRRCSSSCRPWLHGTGGSLRGRSCSASSSRVVLFVPVGRYSLAINLPFGLELYRSRSRSSCSCGWPRFSSTREFAFGVRHSMRRSRSSSQRLSAPSPSTSGGWRLSPRQCSRLSRSSSPSSSSSISSASVVTERCRRCRGHAVHRVRRRGRRVLRDRRAEDRIQRLRPCSKRLPVPAVRRVDDLVSGMG